MLPTPNPVAVVQPHPETSTKAPTSPASPILTPSSAAKTKRAPRRIRHPHPTPSRNRLRHRSGSRSRQWRPSTLLHSSHQRTQDLRSRTLRPFTPATSRERTTAGLRRQIRSRHGGSREGDANPRPRESGTARPRSGRRRRIRHHRLHPGVMQRN